MVDGHANKKVHHVKLKVQAIISIDVAAETLDEALRVASKVDVPDVFDQELVSRVHQGELQILMNAESDQ